MLYRLIKRDWLLLALLVLVACLLALPVLTYPLGRDQGEFATIGRGILNGRVPYIDLWNPKPPAVFYVYALAMRLLGQNALALRMIDFVVVPICCACLFWIGRALMNCRVGLWAALLFPVFYFTETFWTLTQNDGIVLVPMLLAMVCVLKVVCYQSPVSSVIRRSLVYTFVTGGLAGYVVWYKYPFALFGVLLALVYVWQRWREGMINRFNRGDVYVGMTYTLGVALALGSGALLLMVQGAWDEFLRSAQVTAQYTALTFNADDFTALMGTAIGYRWQYWGLLFVLALVGVINHQPSVNNQQSNTGVSGRRLPLNILQLTVNPNILLFLAWLVTGFIIMLSQAKGYDYHWLPMLPPLVLLGAVGVSALQGWLARVLSPALTTVIISAGLLLILVACIWPTSWRYLTGQEDQVTYYGRFVAGEFVADESLEVVNLLRERVVPGDSLYIWGFRPEVYYLSGLNPATRFIFQFPLVGSWYPPEWRQQNVETLWAALPPYVLVLQVDYMPWVTGSEQDSNTLLQEYTELNNWLVYNYERDTQIGNFFVWRRKQP